MSDQRALAKGLHELALQFAPTPRNSMPTERVAVYVRQLSDLPLPAVLAALDRCGKTCDEFPSVSAIRKEVGQHAAAPDTVAESAWNEVQREIRRVGFKPLPVFRNGVEHPAPEPTFSTPIIAEAVESVGWGHLCTADTSKQGVDPRRDFIFAYRALEARAVGQIQRGNFTTVPAGKQLSKGRDAALDTGEVA